ncbi:hypothetical protein AM587_10002494 [Phytophthora nicotianae]|uniref:Uncharacterized protein n=2 Tax=Phytophthora nicotianae TaxID=4792 RepID=A0A0W8DDM8_PHYNI|nr:hypothetical protein AM587_10002494 [Phytophthora nicotianae]
MDLPATSRLYNEALAAAKFADQRLEARTRVDYTGSLRRFVEFCKQEGYPNPIQQRFVELPGAQHSRRSSRDKQKRAGRRDMVYITLLSERRGAIQIYVCSRKTEVVPETRQVVGCGSQSEKSETVVHYLLDDVMDREENQLGDSLAPDVVMPSTTVRESVLGMEYESTQYEEAGFDCYRALSSPRGSSDFSTSVVNDIKEAVLTGLRDMVKDINGNGLLAQVSVNEEGRNPGGTSTAIDTTHLVSELPDAKSWRDYVTQYWTSNPERHQYRAGVNMLPHERKIHRSRLSRMKFIAEFVQARLMGIWIALKPSLAV